MLWSSDSRGGRDNVNRLAPVLILGLALVVPGNSPQNQSASNPSAPGTSASSAASVESKVACTDNSKPESALPPPGPQCAEEEFAKRGRPAVFSAHGGITHGVSSTPGNPPWLYIWMDNQTDETQNYLFCCGTTFSTGIEVYNADGHRLLSRKEQAEQKARAEGRETVEVCTCSGWVSVLPHTMKIVDQGNLMDAYLLKSGRYTITEKLLSPAPGAVSTASTEFQKTNGNPPSPGLTISVP
jgi:hypothetical protein